MSVEYWRRTSACSWARSSGAARSTKPPFEPDRDDDRVLDHLGLHQAEHLGAEVLAPVRPADAAAGDHPAAQVDALHLRAVDEDLEQRARLRASPAPRPSGA